MLFRASFLGLILKERASVGLGALALPLLASCTEQTDGASGEEGPSSTAQAVACPASPAPVPIASCPAPAAVRRGRVCSGAAECPSANLLEGVCRCDGERWSCAKPPPSDYDPFPDCPADGATAGDACYLEGSMCLPRSATSCFTSGVPLCACKGHAWSC
jgi:hypothetical protein